MEGLRPQLDCPRRYCQAFKEQSLILVQFGAMDFYRVNDFDGRQGNPNNFSISLLFLYFF